MGGEGESFFSCGLWDSFRGQGAIEAGFGRWRPPYIGSPAMGSGCERDFLLFFSLQPEVEGRHIGIAQQS